MTTIPQTQPDDATVSNSGATLAERIRKRQAALVRELNDQHIFVQQALPVLEKSQRERAKSKDESDRRYVVPSRKKKGVARRTDAEVKRIYDAFLDRELFATSLIAAVSRTEAFVFDVLRMVLVEYPQKLAISVQGNRGDLSVQLSDVLSAKALVDLTNSMIDRRLNAASYATPRDYLTYFEAVTGIGVAGADFDSFVEIKATRDLLVHNSGIVNATYLEKVGAGKRAKAGKLIPVDRAYYDLCIAVLKKVAGLINSGGWRAFNRGG